MTVIQVSQREPGTIVENKRLTEVLAYVQAQQATYSPCRHRCHPGRQRPRIISRRPGNPRGGDERPRARWQADCRTLTSSSQADKALCRAGFRQGRCAPSVAYGHP
jgi:hypothetical protein